VSGSGIPAWEVLVPIAALMAVTTAYLIKWAAEATTTLRAAVVIFLLLMMVAMVGGAAFYFADPGTASLVGALWLASGLMSVSVVIVFFAFLKESGVLGERPPAAASPPRVHTPLFVAAVVGLVVLDELLMGWTFTAASGALPPSAGALGLFTTAVNSPWFLFTMSGEMLLTAFLLRARLGRATLFVLVAQSVIMLLSPPALALSTWASLAVYASSALMIALFVFLMEYLYRTRQLTTGVSRYLVRLLWVYGLMMTGLFVWLYYGSGLVFALSVVAEMVLFFDAIIRPAALAGPPVRPWLERPHWAFAVLAGIFVAEIFMGAVLSVQLDPATYVGAFGTYPLVGPPAVVLQNAFYNGFWFFATVTASTWFLAMMGIEMGALVAFKMRESHHLENRIRLGLMMVSYAMFAVFYPSLYFALILPNAPPSSEVPVLGWSMGIGSYPLATTVFIAVALTYAITGGLTVLFGRRVICATFCTAPLMYNGTTIDSMKSFNRTGTIGHKYQSSRISSVYAFTAGTILAILVLTSLLSYLDSIGATNVYVLNTDPSIFFFVFSFSILWYVFFVTIPYVGNFNCVTMGWCYTGVIASAFQKIGFFKLKVDSPQVCRDCTTLDCAKGCPVALVDMPGHLRTKGEFRSSKCCGVGDCVEACPYNNLYVYDIRHWIRERLRLPARPRPHRLPMIPTPRPTPALSASPGASLLNPLH